MVAHTRPRRVSINAVHLALLLFAQLVADFHSRWRDADNNEPLCAAAATSQVGRFDVQAIELWALTEV